MVKVQYGEPYKSSFGKKEEKFKAKTIEEVVTKIEKKYKGRNYVETIRPYSILTYKKCGDNECTFVSKKEEEGKYVYDSDIELKKDDELMFMMMVGGG